MRWTPLILRELMCDAHTFNDIHRGVPLISRALLAERLRQLDEQGIIEKKPRPDGSGCEYRLTPAGYAFHDALRALAQWGLLYGRDRLSADDLNPGLLMWRMRRRADTRALPKNRVVVHFEFSGVPASRTRLRTMWLILERPRRRRMPERSRLPRRPHGSRRYRRPHRNLSGIRELEGHGRPQEAEDRGRQRDGAPASNMAQARQAAGPRLPAACAASRAGLREVPWRRSGRRRAPIRAMMS